jgi:3'-phosphoadenosine 5'-phosphosulfate (PAPS) 3'-phosphatase
VMRQDGTEPRSAQHAAAKQHEWMHCGSPNSAKVGQREMRKAAVHNMQARILSRSHGEHGHHGLLESFNISMPSERSSACQHGDVICHSLEPRRYPHGASDPECFRRS